MAPVSITVTLPGMLANCVGGVPAVTVEAGTLPGSVEALLEAYPLLKVHLFQEDGTLREHVMLLYNDQSFDWLDSTDIPLQEGDRLTVLQLVSGG